MAVQIAAHAEPLPGYRLIDRLGGGGFGEVWRAEAPGGMHKAIKFVYGDLDGAGDKGLRAEQELKALKRIVTIRHPYILSLERYEVIDGQLLIVMELADRNLWDRFKECRAKGLPGIPREELLRYMEETAEALDLMNREYQLQHLDIKPQNLFLIHQHVKVGDFGLVKDLENSLAVVTGGITPVYAAPETFDARVTRYSDQYSLGIVYQELLTGQRPFSGSNVRQLIMQHLSGMPNVSALPFNEQPIILRALAKEPKERFPTCRDMVVALRAAEAAVSPPVGQPAQPGALTVPTQVPGQPGSVPVPSSWQGVVTPPPSGPPTANLRSVAEGGSSSQGATQYIRGGEVALSQLGATKAPKELNGSGCLFPAVVIGLGHMGMTVLKRLREALHVNVCPLTQLPNLRFLLLDTDAEVVRQATHGAGGSGLAASEVLLAPLNRANHYLKSRDGKPPLQQWLNPRLLYRIPRSQLTAGVRALGRLAFVDHYRAITRRLQLELESALEPQALQGAARASRLGMRTNRPRVYIITSLGGGTGSGMFIDLAYTMRALLKQLGYEAPEVIGVLLAPPVDGNRTRLMTLGNTYAALMELNYFGAPGAIFQAAYHEKEQPIQEPGPPFTRNVILPLPEETDEVATQEVVDLTSQFLYRDLATPLGKAADLGRAGLPATPWPSRGQYFQTFNLYLLTWPRLAMLQVIARKLCQRTVQRWMSKDSKPLREVVQHWVQDQCARLELSGEGFIQRLQTEVVKRVGGPVESLFNRLIEPLSHASAQGEPPGKSKSRPDARTLVPSRLAAVLNDLEELIGQPLDEGPPSKSGVATALATSSGDQVKPQPMLIQALRQATDKLTEEWSQQMAELSVHLIEEPAFRLAGAEEAARQLVALIEQELQSNEPLANDLTQKAKDAWMCLNAHISTQPGQRRQPLSANEMLELVRAYPKWRYQGLVLQHLGAAFVSLRGNLSDQLREVNFCRVRMGELSRSLESPAAGELSLADLASAGPSLSRRLFLSGCRNLRDAVQQFLDEVMPDTLVELDVRMEAMIRERFTALVHVCLTTANIVRDVEMCMLEVAQDFAAERLPHASAAQLFLEQHPDLEDAQGELERCFDEASPELSTGRSPRAASPTEMLILAAPDDEASQVIRRMLQEAKARMEVLSASGLDDVVIYRERLNLLLQDLPQLGPVGHDAYVQMTGSEQFTPHCRSDIDFRGR